MKKLFAQIVKFGIVGVISFGIDYVTGLIVLNLVMALTSSSYFEAASLIGSVAGFTVSVIANYILSFKFVFERKEEMNKKVEFITFVVLSLIGMLLNSFLIWIVVGPIYIQTLPRHAHPFLSSDTHSVPLFCTLHNSSSKKNRISSLTLVSFLQRLCLPSTNMHKILQVFFTI